MRKISPKDMFFIAMPVRERGFAVAAFDFVSARQADDKMPALPADFLPRALPHGRKP